MSDDTPIETLDEYYNILGKIEELSIEDIMNDPAKLARLEQLYNSDRSK